MRPARGRLVLLLFLGLVLAAFGAARPRPVAAAGKPNVLFIAVDDLNDWIGPLKAYTGLKTPNYDRLAKRGITFTRNYCAAPACNPSRAALMTGKLPSTSGVYHNDQPWRPVMPDVETLPQHFRANGYHVRAGGKLFHNIYNDPASWDVFVPPGNFPEPANRPVNGIPRAAHFDWGPVNNSDEELGDWKTTDWALEFLAQKQEKPFFLGVGYIKPHLPWFVPKKYFDMYPLESIKLPKVKPGDLDDVPAIGRSIAKPNGDHRQVVEHDQWEKAVQGYMAAITFADAALGRLLDGFDRSPNAANTIIVFWGDHGWHLGEKEHWRKFALWEEAARTPLIIVPLGGKNAGTRCDRTVNLIDLYPTLIDLCGLTPKEGLEAHSLAPLVADPKAPWRYPSLTTHGRNNHSVRSERWRYIQYSDGTEELYDHDADPQEWTNLAGKPELASVKSELKQWLPKVNAPDAPRRPGPAE